MQGYNPQFDDYNHYTASKGKFSKPSQGSKENAIHSERIDLDAVLAGHDNAAEIAALCGHVYRPENLHNNGDICDHYNEQGANLARVTKEHKAVSRADIAEQASRTVNGLVLWDMLADAYNGFVKNTRRWRDGYQPEAIKPDARFMQRVKDTRLRMQKNRTLRASLRNRAKQLGILK